MRLKSLEVTGFKSFLEPTLISFAPGITAVVGPNGCGKSNVVDAIRWVLGEQAPTRLRGKLTEDLIYAGNDSNPAAGMAEVSLLLEAEESIPLPDPFTNLSEVYVTRRVYRSGESEYLLNKIPCRLKDITEFFMAAQIHSRGYAIIEQGKIEEIIQSKPDELRSIIEEAAGLSLFKGRREMSERKLERVKENLDRLNDVLGEIERQLNFARRQAKKAEAYKQIRLELDQLEKIVAARRILHERAELEAHSARETLLKTEAETARAECEELRTTLDALMRELSQSREQLAAQERELENLRAQAAERTRTRGFMTRRIAAIDELHPTLNARVTDLDGKATASRAARAELGARLAREKHADADIDHRLAEAKSSHDAALFELTSAEEATETAKDQISDLMREAAIIRGRLGDLAGERAELEQAASSRRSIEELENLTRDANAEMQRADSQLAEARARFEQAEATRNGAAEHEIEARGALENHRSHMKGIQQALSAATRRAERLAKSLDGERLKVVLDSMNGDGPSRRPEFLLNVIKAPSELGNALGAVLGEQLGAVICESPDFAMRAIEILKELRRGRLSFVPETVVAVAHAPLSAPGITGRLLDMVQVEPQFNHVAEAMLGHVLIADDVPSAMAAANLNGHGTVFVTRDGDVVWPGRAISGGSAPENQAPLEDDHLSVEEARTALTQAEATEAALRERLEQLRASRERSQEALAQVRAELAQAEQNLQARRVAYDRAHQAVTLERAYRSDSSRRIAEIEKLIPASNLRLEELALAEQQARTVLAELKTQLAERKAIAEQIGSGMLEIAAQADTRRVRLDGIEQELRHVATLSRELESQLDETRRGIERAASERDEYQRELAKLAGQDELGSRREAEVAEAVDQGKAALIRRQAEAAQHGSATRERTERLTSLEKEIVECGFGRERASTLAIELLRSFTEKFQTEFDAVRDELEATLQNRDALQDENRLKELRAKAEKIGEVNLAAESEVKELEERSAQLNAQRTDLEAAVRDLTQTIQKLNREARKRFAETFEGAAKHFSEVFPKLMRGGKAHLELSSPDDLLESGVNILVQPVGKKVKDISLLSGGEKALSAMALVFSLFLLNPSPFCLLDEVDAPLDEFSVAAFTGLIRELKERSQFIVITHNQRTMQIADHIHGVTMDKPGISRIISIKMPEAA